MVYSLPVTRHNDAIVLDQDTQPYFCLHNYPEEMTGTCYSLLNGQVHPHFNQKLLNNGTGAEFHNKLQQFTLCQKRATLMPNGAFQMTFLDNKTVNFPSELDCRLQWRVNPDDPREQIFVHSGSVIITNTQFAYIFAESDMVLNGSTLVNRIPLHDLFVCDPTMKDAHFEPKEIMFMAVLGIFGSILLLEFAYLLGAFEVCFPTNLPALPPARKRTRSPSKSGSKKRRKESPKNVKKNEAKRDEEFMEDASDGNGQENSQNTNWEESTSGGSSSMFESNNPVQAYPDGSQQYQAAMQHYPQSGGTLPVDYPNVAVPPSTNVPLDAYPQTYNPDGQFQVQSEVYPGYSQAAQSQAPQSTYNEQPNSNAVDMNSQPNNYNNTQH